MAASGFWDNQERAQERVGERKSLVGIVKPLDEALAASDDLAAMLEMADDDPSFAAEAPGEVERLEKLLEDRKVKLELDDKAREWLAEAGYDPIYGARPLKRVIQRNLQDRLAGLLLEGSIKDGEVVRVTASQDGLEVRPGLAAAA